MDLFNSMRERKSMRAFLDTPVSREDVEEIIGYGGMAPSAINLQPWEYIVTYGEEKDRLIRRIQQIHSERKVKSGPGTSKPLHAKYADRGRGAMKDLETATGKTGIEFNRFVEEGSCTFYGAPVVIMVTMDRIFPKIRYIDVGLSLSYIFLAAHSKGLSTCPVGLITAYSDDIADVLNIPDNKEILLAIALGYGDKSSPVNNFKSSRENLSEILRWYE